jgi:riboflavin biosynthesis pyrimidine reductase
MNFQPIQSFLLPPRNGTSLLCYQRGHRRRRPRTVWISRLAEDTQNGVLGEGGGPAMGLRCRKPAMDRIMVYLAPIQQGYQHVHIQ